MARTKVDRSLALKAFVDKLMANHPNASTFTRADVEVVGKVHPIGFTEFASVSAGYGSSTRVGRGQYAIPSDWLAGKAPWTGVDASVDVPAPKAPKASKAPKAPKASKTPKTKKTVATNVVETAVVAEPVMKKNSNPKKSISKKELFEKAKAEIAKRKNKDVAAEAGN